MIGRSGDDTVVSVGRTNIVGMKELLVPVWKLLVSPRAMVLVFAVAAAVLVLLSYVLDVSDGVRTWSQLALVFTIVLGGLYANFARVVGLSFRNR